MGTSRLSRQKSLLAGRYDGKGLPALERMAVSAHWLFCNKSPPGGLPALSEEHKRDSTGWNEIVGVSEGFDPSSSPGITMENTPSLLHSHRVQESFIQVAVVQVSTFLWKKVFHLTAQLHVQNCCLVCFWGMNIERSHTICLKTENCVRHTRAAQLPFPVLRSTCTLQQGSSFLQETLIL